MEAKVKSHFVVNVLILRDLFDRKDLEYSSRISSRNRGSVCIFNSDATPLGFKLFSVRLNFHQKTEKNVMNKVGDVKMSSRLALVR